MRGRRAGETGEVKQRFVLRAIGGRDALQFAVVRPGSTVRIGRDPGTCHLVLSDTSVSREHCAVYRDRSGRLMLEDLGSTHGTMLNGRPVSGPTPLGDGDVLRVGEIPVLAEELTVDGLSEAVELAMRLAAGSRRPRVWNRQYVEELVPPHVALLDRAGVRCSAVAMEVDGLADKVDNLGKRVVEAVMRAVGRVVLKSLRAGDRVARFGPAELVAVLPNCSEEGAAVVAERLVRAVGERADAMVVWPSRPTDVAEIVGRITLSAGSSTYRSGERPGRWIERAFAAMRAAHRWGGDRVVNG